MSDKQIKIPVDIYESPQELVIVMPMWWVKKEDIKIRLEKTNLNIAWIRKPPKLKENLKKVQQECFWWEFKHTIPLPKNIFFDKISSKLTDTNILIITVPKIIIPEKLEIQIV